MGYQEIKESLLQIFNENDFELIFKESMKRKMMGMQALTNSKAVTIKNKNNIDIKVNFPGYKTEYKYGKLVYDYRVDLKGVPISHANIVVDLYNKSVQAPRLRETLKRFIVDLAIKGDDIDISEYQDLIIFNYLAPNETILNEATNAHLRQNKRYQINANKNINYSIYELIELIPILVTQEDINYPMPRFNGRRMSFYRYIEAIECINKNYTLTTIIERTLSHGRPRLFDNIDYLDIINIVNEVNIFV